MPNEQPWYTIGFDADYPIMQTFEEEMTGIQASSAEWLLNLSPRARILDLCCGYGRHSLVWRRDGYHPVGLDMSADLLGIAHKNHPKGPWVRGDVRCLPFAGATFDAATFMFVSFGYFKTTSEDLEALREARRILRPGGGIYLDIKLPSSLRANQPPDTTFTISNVSVTEACHIVQSREGERYEIRRTLSRPGGAERKYFYSVRLYEPETLCDLIQKAGFEEIHLYGDYDATTLTPDQPRLVAIAKNPA